MDWLVSNWTLIVTAAAVIGVLIVGIIAFFKLPVATQKTKVKEWLLWAVTEAEKQLGKGTGQLKLRKVYEMFISKFSFLSSIIPFEIFSKWVDEALDKMEDLLANNTKIAGYVSNETDKE